jgi:hypothetical protein
MWQMFGTGTGVGPLSFEHVVIVQKTYFRFSSVWYWATDFFTKGNAGQIVQCASPL